MTEQKKTIKKTKVGKVKPTPAPRKLGRPSSFTQELADRICDKIATTSHSLKRICAEDETLPSAETIRMWCWKNPEFHAQYARAKEQQQVWMAEHAQEIADDGTNDTYVDDDGNVRVDTDVIQRSRLRVDTIKWQASKLAPKKFGDKIDVNHGGQADNPVMALYQQITGTPFKPEEK